LNGQRVKAPAARHTLASPDRPSWAIDLLKHRHRGTAVSNGRSLVIRVLRPDSSLPGAFHGAGVDTFVA
jgi:hypothetical protein